MWRAAVIIFLAGAALGTLLTFSRPAFTRILLGPAMVASIERHEMWTHSLVGDEAAGVDVDHDEQHQRRFYDVRGRDDAGLRTLYLLFYNGLQLGVVATACAQARMALDLWSFVASHGALELPSIFIAGGAGLRLATGMLFPGIYTRSDSLSRAAVDAIRLVAGTVPLLVIAGTLEGFLSPSGAPVAVKFLTGAVLLLGLGLWLTSGDWPGSQPDALRATGGE